jgi:hypothetical protein
MQTTVDAHPDAGGRPPRRRTRWLVALAALAAVVAGALVLRLGGGDPDPDEPATLPEQLAARVVETLEASSTSEHAAHGHHFGEACEPNGQLCDAAAVRIVCAAEAFGFEPAEATTVDEVEVVYAHHMCAEVGTGFGWPDAIRAAGPLAVELTDPVTVLLPEQALAGEEGVAHADRIRAIIPERYHEAALAPEGFADPGVAERLRERFEAAAG